MCNLQCGVKIDSLQNLKQHNNINIEIACINTHKGEAFFLTEKV